MAFENLSYDIEERMPHWWRDDKFLTPINRYSQELIKDIIGALLGNFGVVQPFHVWLTFPTEYSYIHNYQSDDSLLKTPDGGSASSILYKDMPIYAYLPNSKRNCEGVIKLRLEGDSEGLEKSLKKLVIKNAGQTITIHNITTTTNIQIFTESGTILIDGVERNDLVKGQFNKIYSQAKNTDYDNVDIDDENKITYVSFEADTTVNFSLEMKLIHPIYVVEQNMRIHTVSAFPIEWVKLYGFYCNEFNNKQEWRFLWEKKYREIDRVVFDRITKQFDCEVFYMQVKLYGIGIPFVYGFPQQEFSSNAAFQINNRLDKWGKIYGLPRRHYKTQISEEETPYTYPPFYTYPIEQDYWYEERLVNEYRHNDDAINASFVRDSNFNNVGILRCIDPRIEDIYVYTETINQNIDNNRKTEEIIPTSIFEEDVGVEWKNPYENKNIGVDTLEVKLQPQSSETFNTKENQSKILKISFDIPTLPKNIKIKGIELLLYCSTDIHSESLILDDRSQMLLPTYYTKQNNEVFKRIDNIQINNDIYKWEKGKKLYKIGGPNDLFNVQEITRNQIQDGLTFNLAFTNLNTFLKSTVTLYSIGLVIHYELIENLYDMSVNLNRKEIVLKDPDKQSIQMKISLKNTGETTLVDKNVYIIAPDELSITNTQFPTFDLDVGESFIIGDNSENEINDEIIITPKKYEYLSLQTGAEISQSANDTFFYKMDNYAEIDIYINDEKIDTITANTSSWKKYTYDNKIEDKTLTIKIRNAEGNVYIKNPEQWTSDQNINTVEQIKTGLYDILVFCDDKIIKNEIIVKEGL